MPNETSQLVTRSSWVSKNHRHATKQINEATCVICQVTFVDDPNVYVEPTFEDACEVCDIVGQCDFTCSRTASLEGLPAFGSAINARFDEEL